MESKKKPASKPASWFKKNPEIQGIVWLGLAISLAFSLVTFRANAVENNLLGLVGHGFAALWYFLFGFSSFAIVFGLAWFGIKLIFSLGSERSFRTLTALFSASLFLSLFFSVITFDSLDLLVSKLMGFDEAKFRLGGVPMALFYQYGLQKLLGATGCAIIASIGCFLSLTYFFEFPLLSWLEKLKVKLFTKEEVRPVSRRKVIDNSEEIEEIDVTPKKPLRKTPALALPQAEPVDLFCDLEEEHPVYAEPKASPKSKEKATITRDISLPSIDLLNMPKKSDQSQLHKELKQKADLLEETLLSFGIEAKVGQIHCGPTITSFEVHPAVGVKIGKIKTLEHDIALNLEAKAIRIIAPIPGKAAVGIEVPNSSPQEVSFRDMLSSYQQKGSPFRIPMLLGKAVNGDMVIADLCKMPHCIIAGATGSGKSVCINSIVMSIVMCAKPEEIRLLMIDPKKVELTQYTQLPHMIAPVICEPNAACMALNWLVKEMEKRYEILKLTGQRNIEAFNKRKINVEAEKAFTHVQIPEKFPYFVAIIDELADLMMVASQDIETPIARIAQMARAVGIHLILATQRPSREVITGLIRANFPARIAFKVASRINSQIILDDVGAETLLGNGDMLFLQPGTSQLLRAQGVFVRDEEINKVIEDLVKQGPPQYLINSFDGMPTMSDDDDEDEASDTLFDEAKNIVLSTGNASTTFLQRKLKIGYARAASLMDMLEARGIVGPQEGARARKVLFPKSAASKQEDDDFDDAEF